MDNAVYEKIAERNRRYIKLITSKARRNCFVLVPNYHTSKIFSKNLLALE